MYSSKQQKQKPKEQSTETHRFAYCGKDYPASEMGCIGYGVYICRRYA